MNAKKLGTATDQIVRLVDPKLLKINPDNERDYLFDAAEMLSLRQSLAAEGVKTPLHIYDDGTVDDGNRRLFNIQYLMQDDEWKHGDVPAIVVPRPKDVVEAVFQRLNKNESAQFDSLAQGRAFAKLRGAGLNNSQIAARSPFTSMHVGNMLTLYDASQAIRDAVRDLKVSATLAVEAIRKHGEQVVLDAIALAAEQGKDKATQRHIDAVLASSAPVAVPVEVEAEAEAEAVEVEAEAEAEAVEVEAEAEAEAVEAEAEADDVPFDGGTPISTAVPTGPVVDAEEEVTAPAAKPTRVDARAMVAMLLPTVQALISAQEGGTNAERLEALDEAMDDLTAFVASARLAGIQAD